MAVKEGAFFIQAEENGECSPLCEMDFLFKHSVKVAYFSLPGLYSSFTAMHIMHTMLDMLWYKMPFAGVYMCVCVCMYVIVQVLFQKRAEGPTPGGSQLRFISVQQTQLSNIFLLRFSHQQLNWGEKVNLKQVA